MEIDPNRPSTARIYERLLGGTHHFAADRAVADRAVELVPELPAILRQNRDFRQRAVRFAAGRGVRQFLDLGSGIPAEQDMARSAPGSRVTYVDIDPVAVLHARDVVGGDASARVVEADLCAASTVLGQSGLDLTRPVCLLMVGVLHFVPDAAGLSAALATYREAAAPGSLQVILQAGPRSITPQLATVAELYTRVGTPLILRSYDEVTALFDGWDLLPPGIVPGPAWGNAEPVGELAASMSLAGVATRG